MADLKYVDGGVCASKGFKANGLNCGLNSDKNKNDLGLVISDELCTTAAVYTTNKVKGAPILVTKAHIEKTNGLTKAIIANSKNANTCNADGVEIAEGMCELLAAETDLAPEQVVVASTGVIGAPLSLTPFKNSMKDLVAGLTYDGNDRAVNAIMTTDTVPKQVAVEFMLGGKVCHLGGMGKGSGMIHPNMATTLNFITSDVAISAEMVEKALKEIVKITYNCLTVDGDTSTNDMVSVMCNGMAGNAEITAEGADYDVFYEALYTVMRDITKMLAADGEGASKLIEVQVSNAPDLDTAIAVAKSVAGSNLLKCAIFGEDANWGRVLCAIGYTDKEFDINKVDLKFESDAGSIDLCENGAGVPFSEEIAATILKEKEIRILIDLKQGEAKATAWGCDLTYDYVKINGDYRS